ncbi:MAG: S-layer homology domain-containing protein [Firmicutes bacterium]|nr:S-layer homology domain-containing protein [Bacillota bacterium]
MFPNLSICIVEFIGKVLFNSIFRGALDYNKFTDTQNPYILLANELGIVNGFSDKTFAPYEYITRQQAAVMLNNTAKLLGLKGESAETFFADSSDFENWAVEAIKNVSAIKNKEGIALMLGVGENKFLPKMNYTREQAYITIYRLYDMCK